MIDYYISFADTIRSSKEVAQVYNFNCKPEHVT